MTFAEELEQLGPCPEAVDWIGDKTLRESWDDCDNLVWMLWVLGKTAGWVDWPSHQTLVELVCLYVEQTEGFTDKYHVLVLARQWEIDEVPYWKAYEAAEEAAADVQPERNAEWAGYATKSYWVAPSQAYKAFENSSLEDDAAILLLRALIPSSSLPETLSG